jgi:hypothetical protein
MQISFVVHMPRLIPEKPGLSVRAHTEVHGPGSGMPATTPFVKSGRHIVWGAFVLLFLLHQDFWWWDNATLVWGVLPVGMFYHILFSIAAALLWLCASRWAWPDHLEEWAAAGDSPAAPGTAAERSRSPGPAPR